ncbi:glycosyltransferase [Alicyclobacillus fastidiosus]|uniref:glycosyltransferase n=1 Tax=Alicyclobacillus fastidiosus TaxID=392011 RepID=UPI0023EA1D30|nr:glycosyltransferase [Alicyclobacillus fastidiosus]GMA66133.1 hypothetical protein GCM10025859_65750 [Alicyclobacillus fastidiosus]
MQNGRTQYDLDAPLSIPKKLDILSTALKRQIKNLDDELSHHWGHDWRNETVVYVTNWTPYQYRIIERLNPQYVIFDCVDDVLSFPYGWNREEVVTAWRRLAELSSSVLAVSPTLRNQMEELLNRRVVLLPNGVDAELFMNPSPQVPAGLERNGNQIRVGFAGTLNHWIDFDAMLSIVDTFPEVTLFLLGKEGQMASDRHAQSYRRLLEHENVRYFGAVPYEDLPGYLQALDILLLPRISSKASTSSNPLKLFEYLAVGKPIVVDGVPITSDVNRLVYTTNEKVTFQDAFRNAMVEVRNPSKSKVRDRQAYALTRTWDQRVNRALKSVLPTYTLSAGANQ